MSKPRASFYDMNVARALGHAAPQPRKPRPVVKKRWKVELDLIDDSGTSVRSQILALFDANAVSLAEAGIRLKVTAVTEAPVGVIK